MRGQDWQLEWWNYFARRAQALRRTGSTALNLVYVAAGRFDAYWGFDNNPWDVAGAIPIIREAGGVISKIDGSPYDIFSRPCIASNGPLHPAMIAAFAQ
jgi:myo-inositol-1(or 4)-monophosphatase